MHRVTLLVLAALSLLVTSSSVSAQYADDFEAAGFDPYWTVVQLSGSASLSTDQAHSGVQSVKFATVNTPNQKDVELSHSFSTPAFGTFTLWFYDVGAGQSSGNYSRLFLTVPGGPSGTWGPSVLAQNDSSGTGNQYYGSINVPGDFPSSIARTTAWHEFRIQNFPASLDLAIDGQSFYSGPAVGGATSVTFAQYGAGTIDPAATNYFDDFKFIPFVPEPTVAALLPLALLLRGRRRQC